MAEPTSLLDNPEAIKALTETLKVIFAGIGSLGVALGTVYTFLSNRNARVAKANTEVTAVNTATLSTHTDEMLALKAEAKTELKAFKSELSEMLLDLATSVNKLKLVSVKVANAADQKLGLIPRVQDTLAQQQKEIETERKRTDEILEVITKGKAKNELPKT